MGSTLSVVKTLIIPAVIALIVFVISTYVFMPLWRRYRSRYSHYLPLDTISNHTSSLRSRVQHIIARWIIPAQWRMGSLGDRLVIADGASDTEFSEDEGEELDVVGEDRRRALSLDTRNETTDSMRRLSRDLEEGFMDDSDEEVDQRQRRR